jgi:hypothetical protein
MMTAAASVALRWLLVLFLAAHRAKGFSLESHRKVVVIGKLIIDEYRSPDQSEGLISIGGGGPQAAWSAAAALAILSGDEQDPPSPQPVTFLGPVGKVDWTEREETALQEILGPAVEKIRLLPGDSLRTPRIQLWHDEEQNVQWRPLFDSLGPQGAGGLWRRPCPNDFLDILDESEVVTCHAIVEGGTKSPGDGDDALFLMDPSVQERIGFLGVEPVVFADERTGRVSDADAQSCTSRLEALSASLDFVSPDMPLFQEIEPVLWNQMEVGIRNGPKGSLLLERDGSETLVPAATLVTCDGLPVNPTGAGNGYAAAFTACRGSGASAVDSACIASAIGAVFCEYDHIPLWNASVLRRIRQAAEEIGYKVSAGEKVKG